MTATSQSRTRDLGPSDAHALAELSLRIGAGETVEQWQGLLHRPGAIAIAAVEDGRLVGYAAGEIRSGFGMPGRVAWLELFGVELERRGAGVGRLLLADLLERFAGAGATHVYTLTAVHDQVLAPFLRQVGFRDEPFECLGRAL